ncbi:MAG: FtsQ-type POTRA domain-containing protein [Deltaproteobacteria bacterium]|nr:FtsQ-type POTRA domain-containing protein [Deltaproteobacteria bacterium]
MLRGGDIGMAAVPAIFPSDSEAGDRQSGAGSILRSVLLVMLCGNAALAVLLAYVIFLHFPYFTLHHVEVMGNHHLSGAEVIEASEVETGTNLLTLDLGAVASRLKRHPWVKAVSVYRKLPGRLVIEIQERNPRAILAAGKLYYVDEQGEIFTRVLPGNSVRYPLLTGVTLEELSKKGAEVRKSVRRGLMVLEALEKGVSGLAVASVNEVRISLDRGLTLHTNRGRTLVLGTEDFELKLRRYERLKRFLTRRGEWNNAKFIDLDFEDRALVSPGRAREQG